MAYQHPLHYLLGVSGLALLRAYGGSHSREFADERVDEIRALLESPLSAADGVEAGAVDTVSGYRAWSVTYDEPGNGLFPLEEPFVREIVDALPPGVALDAACGTGRHAAYLAARGHRVIGVDSSPDMLSHARAKVPTGIFHEGSLDRIPLPGDHADLVVCALALAHLPDLRPAFAEFARVLRPGGHLIVTDIHQETVLLGSVPHVRTPTGEPRLIPSYRHRASGYLGAALPLGFEVRRCEEPWRPAADPDPAPVAAQALVADPALVAHPDPAPDPTRRAAPGEWDLWPWTLMEIVPEATGAAFRETPAAVLWHFQLRG